ncbi:hypothetical protein EST62_07670 [Chlorobaculum sp. 24CR]|uniref:hypothetical protein n=1 Tax=Chlorobaculum sp. 24CR TaxID=2508878 RepID=UPI00100B6DEA|nr:hypothetical protein [Chlorobaculum sp. 24CR]RXK85151.1 hypothetical protein EST62_07670 [Chlorobaculum sp. 24CR]
MAFIDDSIKQTTDPIFRDFKRVGFFQHVLHLTDACGWAYMARIFIKYLEVYPGPSCSDGSKPDAHSFLLEELFVSINYTALMKQTDSSPCSCGSRSISLLWIHKVISFFLAVLFFLFYLIDAICIDFCFVS